MAPIDPGTPSEPPPPRTDPKPPLLSAAELRDLMARIAATRTDAPPTVIEVGVWASCLPPDTLL